MTITTHSAKFTYVFFVPVLVLLCYGWLAMREIMNHFINLRETRQMMTQRRQQQRESNNQAMSEDEEGYDHARYELFKTMFHFQIILPGKSNITADRVRNSTGKQDEECPTDEESEIELGDDNTLTPTCPSETTFPERLHRFRVPGHKDESCCICLESCTEGETNCIPITTECSHVFHKDCIYEWLKTKDRCPLCRVELLKD